MFSQFFEVKKISGKANTNLPSSQKHIPRPDSGMLSLSKGPKTRDSHNPKKMPFLKPPVLPVQDSGDKKSGSKTAGQGLSLAKYLQVRSHRLTGEPSRPLQFPFLLREREAEKPAQKSGASLNKGSPRSKQPNRSPSSKLKTTLKNIETKNLWPLSNGKRLSTNSKIASIDKKRTTEGAERQALQLPNNLSLSAVQMKLQSKVSNEYINSYARESCGTPTNAFNTYNSGDIKQLRTIPERLDSLPSQLPSSKPYKNFIVKRTEQQPAHSQTPNNRPFSISREKEPLKEEKQTAIDSRFAHALFAAAKENDLIALNPLLASLEALGPLASSKIDPGLVDEEGSSLAHYAVWHKNEQLFYFLFSMKFDFDKFNTDKITPLMLTALLPWKNAFSLLANIVRDLNAADRFGNTALHYAVVKENLDIVALLLQRPGVLTDWPNKEGHRPIDIAHPRIAVRLQEMFLAYKKQSDKGTADFEIFEEERLSDKQKEEKRMSKSKSKEKSANNEQNLKRPTSKNAESQVKRAQSKEPLPPTPKYQATKNIAISDIIHHQVKKQAVKTEEANQQSKRKLFIELPETTAANGRRVWLNAPINFPQSMSTKNLGFGLNKKSTANLLPQTRAKDLLNNSKQVAEKATANRPLPFIGQSKESLGNLFKRPAIDKSRNFVTMDQRPSVTRFKTEPSESSNQENLHFLKQKPAQEAPKSKVALDIYKSIELDSFKKHKNALSTKLEPGSDLTNNERRIGLNSFYIHSVIGKGSFGHVYLVEKKDSNMFYAMKVLPKERVFKDNLKRYAVTERNVLSSINHPFIVKLRFAFQNKENLFLIMDFQPGSDLGEYLQDEGHFSERRARIYVAEVLLAIEELHRHNIIFRDLKPENILLDAEGHAMLTDFGLSKENVHSANKGAKSFCGSVAYLAPEMIRKVGHGKAMDWYLLGVVLFEMVTGVPPFYAETKEELFHNIKHSALKFPEGISFELQDLLSKLLEKDPGRRIVLDEIKAHPWFAGICWEDVLARKLKPPKPNIKRLKLYHVKEKPDFLDNKKAEFFEIDGWTFVENAHLPETSPSKGNL